LKKIKPRNRGEAERLEIEHLLGSIEVEEARQETQQTQQAVEAFYRGMEVKLLRPVTDFQRWFSEN
jgi:hypothetical protein